MALHHQVDVDLPGLFITFEGGDSCGKTTQISLVAAWLEQLGVSVVRTREPGGTQLGQQLRQLVMHGPSDVDPRCEALLYAADRAYHVATLVRPALAAGKVVLQDRYFDSSIAYQGAARSLGTEEISQLNLWATGGLVPDVTVLLDLDPQVALSRHAGDFDRLESEPLDFHRRVRQQFLDLAGADPQRFKVVDASAQVPAVEAEIRRRLTPVVQAFLEAQK
ncbi:MAG: dTMP kinase [Actinomycetaceae bacterium]|nr:dTMP kinase [Actinomycetaceae bacterium]